MSLKINTYPVLNGQITGRNGTFEMKSIEIAHSEGGEYTRISGIGKSGKVIHGGMECDQTDFKEICTKELSDNELISELRNRNYAVSIWEAHDVCAVTEDNNIELTDKDVSNILKEIDRKQDASVGINWDVISTYINEHINVLKNNQK